MLTQLKNSDWDEVLVVDTETTGRDSKAHRIIEVGVVTIRQRYLSDEHWQCYFNPQQASEKEAEAVHGLSQQFLQDKPKFALKAEEIWQLLVGKTLVIHNAPFDLAFLDAEFNRANLNRPPLAEAATIIDTLPLARRKFPGMRNSLDALCRRFEVDLSQRTYHGALLDASLLAQVYLALTRGQETLCLTSDDNANGQEQQQAFDPQHMKKLIVSASAKKYHEQSWSQLQQEAGSWAQEWF